jgi:hypothetical protein
MKLPRLAFEQHVGVVRPGYRDAVLGSPTQQYVRQLRGHAEGVGASKLVQELLQRAGAASCEGEKLSLPVAETSEIGVRECQIHGSRSLYLIGIGIF